MIIFTRHRIRRERVGFNLLILALLIDAASFTKADVVPAPLFTDHAVLQCEQEIPVWGTATPGEKITVSLHGKESATQAAESGRWSVTFPPLPANPMPTTLTIQGRNRIDLTGVVLGDVWLASGQSNMYRPLKQTADAALDVPAARFPLIRHFHTARTIAGEPATTVSGAWQVTAPETAEKLSAVAHYFAVDLHALTGRPIGVINATWGGTPIEAWIPGQVLAADPQFAPVDERWQEFVKEYPSRLTAWQQARTAAGASFIEKEPLSPRSSPSAPAGLFNGMIHPHIHAHLKGIVWYQGEANTRRPGEYHALFSSLITGWRQVFAQGDLPFYWVQLSSFAAADPRGSDWALLREAQTACLALPATGQAVSLDVGDAGNVHPREKRAIGRRLARLALRRTYGLDIVDSGPVPADIGFDNGRVTIRFDEIQGRLTCSADELRGFELAGEDREFHPARARIIDDSTVEVSSATISHPVAVRYAWRNAPEAGLKNSEGLPAEPFRSDRW